MLWFAIGSCIGVCGGFLLFPTLQMAHKVDANPIMSEEDREALAVLMAENE